MYSHPADHPDSPTISWLTTCMEEIKQDIARIQHATDVARSSSIDRDQHTSIDVRQHTSIDNRMQISVDDNPPRPHTMKSQEKFHTREEIDQLVEEIYRALETTEERLDGRCDDIYFPMDLSISALTSKIEAMQKGIGGDSELHYPPTRSIVIEQQTQQQIDRHSSSNFGRRRYKQRPASTKDNIRHVRHTLPWRGDLS
ncbi:hypothetical protein YC2023_117344 [Brassica napus]